MSGGVVAYEIFAYCVYDEWWLAVVGGVVGLLAIASVCALWIAHGCPCRVHYTTSSVSVSVSEIELVVAA